MEKVPQFFPAESPTQWEERRHLLRDLQRQLQQNPILYRTYRITRYTPDNHLAQWDLVVLAGITSPQGININTLMQADAFLAPIHPTEQAPHKEHSRILRAARAHRNRRAPSQH